MGALPDFSDSLIEWAYDRQAFQDPTNAPFYFRCRKEVAGFRQSETLQYKATMLQSQGVVSDAELDEAWRTIGVDGSHSKFLKDEHILSKYRARVQDCSPDEQKRMRQALSIVAEHQQSALLRDAAAESTCTIAGVLQKTTMPNTNRFVAIETYEQALSYLGADENTSDEFIIVLKTAKVRRVDCRFSFVCLHRAARPAAAVCPKPAPSEPQQQPAYSHLCDCCLSVRAHPVLSTFVSRSFSPSLVYPVAQASSF